MLNMPQLKMLKPTDTRWLSHENTIRSFKRSYIALVVTLETIHEESGDAEAHDLALCLKQLETVAVIYILSEVLGNIVRLCKSLQTKGFDLVQVPLAVSSTLQELHAIQVSPTDAVWYNSLKEKISELNTAGIALDNNFDETLGSFHTRVTDPFISYLTANINSIFTDYKDLLIAFSLFDHRHLPAEADPTYKQYGKDKLVRLCEQYGVESEANENGRVIKLSPDIDSELIQEEWMTYRRLLHTQIGDMQERITEVLQSPVFRQLFPN